MLTATAVWYLSSGIVRRSSTIRFSGDFRMSEAWAVDFGICAHLCHFSMSNVDLPQARSHEPRNASTRHRASLREVIQTQREPRYRFHLAAGAVHLGCTTQKALICLSSCVPTHP